MQGFFIILTEINYFLFYNNYHIIGTIYYILLFYDKYEILHVSYILIYYGHLLGISYIPEQILLEKNNLYQIIKIIILLIYSMLCSEK